MTDRPDLDPGLAQRLRELSDARVTAQVQAAKRSADQRRESRRQFGERRRVGVEKRNSLRAARLRLTTRHQQGDQQP